MKNYTIMPLVLAVAGLVWTAPEVAAQIDRTLAVPAEVPPASFRGNQFVDSRGCVYVRAGVDGATRWVPRVSRSREVVCGFQPTGATRTAGAAPARNAPEVVQITPRGTSAAAPAPAPAATPTPAPAPRVVTPAPAPRPQAAPNQPIRTVASTPATPRVIRPAPVTRPAPVAVPTPRVVTPTPAPRSTATANAGCPGLSGMSKKYMHSGPNVRCGPQAQPHVTLKGGTQKLRTPTGQVKTIRNRDVVVYSGTSGVRQITGQTVIAPRNAYEERRQAVTKVPKGYKLAWEDGRLNPKRGYQTLDGRRKMMLVWTNTVPRQLVDQYSGEVVTRYFPDLQYPYTSPRQQAAAEAKAKVSVKAPKANTVQTIRPRAVSTKSAPIKTRAKPATHRFVQLGTWNKGEEASTVKRLQRAGLPVKIGKFSRNGKEYRSVLMGPYAKQDALMAGLSRAKKMGYSRAKLRK
ncbi:SPOR domain-containing protein [Primorskyibacter sp. S187A]|uniref:SPOR domain-containing protein n=1 Tax=Primorskyibacter sp. S187A TaxID=3415130 RepID=UPI003C7D5B6E